MLVDKLVVHKFRSYLSMLSGKVICSWSDDLLLYSGAGYSEDKTERFIGPCIIPNRIDSLYLQVILHLAQESCEIVSLNYYYPTTVRMNPHLSACTEMSCHIWPALSLGTSSEKQKLMLKHR